MEGAKKSGTLRTPIGDANFIQKKVPTSKKYEGVKSKLTGQVGLTAKDVNIISD
jgi:hypothetical protein